MKKIAALIIFYSFCFSVFTGQNVTTNAITTIKTGSYATVVLNTSSKDKQVEFGIAEIIKAAHGKGIAVTLNISGTKTVPGSINVYVFSDSVQITKAVRLNGLQPPKYSGWQCYSISVKNTLKNSEVWVLASDNSGAM